MMTNRERILAILDGRSPDRIPWIPRMDIWYRAQKNRNALPARFNGMSLRQLEKALDLGTPAREGRVHRVEHNNVDVVVRQEGLDTITEYITPRGTLSARKSQSQYEADSGIVEKLPVEYPLKKAEDYDLWMDVVENTRFIPTYDDYETYDQEIGDDGLPMVAIGDCPFHYWLKDLAGYQQGYLHLMDFPDRVESLLKLIAEKDKELWKIAAASPAKLFLHGVHLSSQFTPPRYFGKYITPYYQEFTQLLHAHGKSLAMHSDNDTSAILGNLKEAGYDMVECFVCAPMAKVTVKDAREVWGNSMIIWGGIPASILEETYPEKDFETYMIELFRDIAPGDAFILGVSDNVMTNSLLSRIEKITEMVERHGKYPITF
jgi:uroporphyrinogen-III decarboxylase